MLPNELEAPPFLGQLSPSTLSTLSVPAPTEITPESKFEPILKDGTETGGTLADKINTNFSVVEASTIMETVICDTPTTLKNYIQNNEFNGRSVEFVLDVNIDHTFPFEIARIFYGSLIKFKSSVEGTTATLIFEHTNEIYAAVFRETYLQFVDIEFKNKNLSPTGWALVWLAVWGGSVRMVNCFGSQVESERYLTPTSYGMVLSTSNSQFLIYNCNLSGFNLASYDRGSVYLSNTNIIYDAGKSYSNTGFFYNGSYLNVVGTCTIGGIDALRPTNGFSINEYSRMDYTTGGNIVFQNIRDYSFNAASGGLCDARNISGDLSKISTQPLNVELDSLGSMVMTTALKGTSSEISIAEINSYSNKILITKEYADSKYLGVSLGDMEKSVYDTNDNGIVDNAERVNSLTVETAVPLGAVFTDTVYDDTTIQAEVTLNTAKVTNVDHPLVETAVPLGAVFTDTVTTPTAGTNIVIDNIDPSNPVISTSDILVIKQLNLLNDPGSDTFINLNTPTGQQGLMVFEEAGNAMSNIISNPNKLLMESVNGDVQPVAPLGSITSKVGGNFGFIPSVTDPDLGGGETWNNDEVITYDSASTTGWVAKPLPQGVAVTDIVIDGTETIAGNAAKINELLASLRGAGIIA